MAQQTINIGASPNDGTGTPLRTSFDYTNQNFTELYTAVGPSGNNIVVPGTATITGDLDVSGNGAFIGIGRVGLQRPFIPTGQNGTTTLDYRWYSTGTTYVTGARIRASSEAAWSSVSAPTRLMFETVPSGAVGLSERYRISGDGLHTWSNVNNVGGTQMTLDGTGLIVTGATITGAATVGTTLGVTGDLTVGTNALKVFPASNRVLINQTTAIQGDSLEVTAKSDAGAISLFGRASDNQSVISFRANGSSTLKASFQGGDAGLEFVTGATVKQTIDSSTGNVTVSLGNLVMGTANKGIDFSINSDASATSELLNDYEEGTFTPTVTSAGGTGIVYVPVGDTGKYTKIGRLVTFTVNLYGTYTGTFSYVRIALPFTVGAANDCVSAVNNSTAALIAGRTDPSSARFFAFSFQGSGETGIYTGSYNV